ncbi:MAG: penicillin-binding protein activator [Paracoccaceae bacterium]|nr:penicillin-binding protein activator [Paracoccaceae bacterium]
MVAFLSKGRKALRRWTGVVGLLALAACDAPVLSGGFLDTTRAVPVALLVPQSSGADGAVLAQSLENAARLAMADLDGVEIDLRVYDTGARPDMAAAAADQAVRDGARVILGPVFAEAASAAGNAVSGRGVPVLAFSNNPDIAGGNVFVLGTTFDTVARRLARYSIAQGRDDIFIVHAQSPAEEIGRDAVARGVAAGGGQVSGTASFALSQEGVIEAIPQIADTARLSGAEALFMTSGTAGALPFLADLLPENGIDPEEVQFIGLQRLDIPSTALTLSGLQNAWFALPDPGLIGQFTSRYAANFGGPPHPNAYLGYDAVAAIGALFASDTPNPLSSAALTQGSGFAGVGGVFRLLSDGTNERGLAVAQIQNQQVIVIDPAPRSFGGAGS